MICLKKLFVCFLFLLDIMGFCPYSRSHGNENYEAPSVFVGSAEFWFAVVVHGPRIPKDHTTFWTCYLGLRTSLAFKPLYMGIIKSYKIRPGFSGDICNSWEFL